MGKKKKNLRTSSPCPEATSNLAAMSSFGSFGGASAVRAATPNESPAASPISESKIVTYEDIASSPPFRFSIGPQKREFFIHSVLLSNQSPAFERLVNGGFKEAREYHAELDNVDGETFAAFVQYAYTGQYGTERPTAQPAPPCVHYAGQCKSCRRAGNSNTFGIFGVPKPPFEPEPDLVRHAPQKPFKQMVSGLQGSREPYFVMLDSRHARAQNDLLAHAKVLVFADYWGVARLRGLSLQKLGKMLDEVELIEERVEEVAALMEHGYDEPRPDDLTKLLLLYSACKVDKLWKSERFRAVFSRHSELSMSLVGAMVDTTR
ncbi:hypothetical protein OQA88_13209 [Cercophora sp. LCS_1]